MGRMITKTITTTAVKSMLIDTDTAEVTVETTLLCGKFTEEDKILHILNEQSTPTKLHVKVIDFYIKTNLYGLSEEKFLEIARKLGE